MAQDFKRGDRVEWNFRGRTVAGRVRRRLTEPTEIGGRVVAGSRDDPRYLVRSDKSGKETVRRAAALRHVAQPAVSAETVAPTSARGGAAS
jgi:hypothetical protein